MTNRDEALLGLAEYRSGPFLAVQWFVGGYKALTTLVKVDP